MITRGEKKKSTALQKDRAFSSKGLLAVSCLHSSTVVSLTRFCHSMCVRLPHCIVYCNPVVYELHCFSQLRISEMVNAPEQETLINKHMSKQPYPT
jgi:hypothetical protein